MTTIKKDGKKISFVAEMPLVIIGAGACGLVAGLAALSAGIEAVVVERDKIPRGSTFMSSGFIPAAGTRFQQAAGIQDTPALMAKDILDKNQNQADPAIVTAITNAAAEVVEWLTDAYQIPFELVEGFLYPGHSRMRMHCTPRRSGEELMSCLLNAAQKAGLPILTEARASTLHVDEECCIYGVSCQRPDGAIEQIGCQTLLLACNGYGASPELLTRHIPQMAEALYFGHEGNQGEAVIWGKALGASLKDMGAYQGHGSLAWPHQTLISWAVMMQGGIQINLDGKRFSNEHSGYSEQAAKVLAQPKGLAFNIFDARIHQQCLQFEDYRNAEDAGAIKTFASAEELAEELDLPKKSVLETFQVLDTLQSQGGTDQFGRHFDSTQALSPPWYAIQATGALFHTQGGLEINCTGQVLNPRGQALPNLYAAGGAARGLSGAGDSGYLSGNGLLSAVVMGALAARAAAASLLASNDSTPVSHPSQCIKPD